MSAGAGRREVAVRCFAAEYDDADYEYSESDEERAPNYVVTPTGARVNRLFVVGVLTEVEPVSEDVLRARVVDPTGAFVVYAGQYQPDAKTFLERADPPTFVAVTGKARTFEPDDGDVVYTSIRPESMTEVDADTRDRWTVQAAEQTIERVAVTAAAVDREERGDALRAVLDAAGIDERLAAGIPHAIDHYGTTEAYLAAVRTLAIDAAAVVAGERDEVDPLDVAPDADGAVAVDLAGDVDLGDVETETDTGTEAPATEPVAETSTPSEESRETDVSSGEDETVEPEPDDSSGEDETVEPEPDDSSDPIEASTEREPTEPEADSAAADPTGMDPDDRYELDDDERAEIEEEFGTEFSTGNEVDDAGEADIDTPGPVDEEGAAETDTDPGADGPETPAGAITDDSETADEAPPDADDVDLEDAVVETMAELDDGEGADRSAIIESVADAHGADRAAVEAAIQDALMAGRCYESGDDRLTAI